jgi:hypothetical protein
LVVAPRVDVVLEDQLEVVLGDLVGVVQVPALEVGLELRGQGEGRGAGGAVAGQLLFGFAVD